jgi:predicted transcriptional regulator
MAQLNQKQDHKRLFPLKGQFRIFELGAETAITRDDHLENLRKLVCASLDKYSGIERWFKNKVVPGLSTSERTAYLAYEDDKPIAAAVLKQGLKSKICHLKIEKDFQDLHLGQMFFTQITIKVLDRAETILFTLPESLWTEKHAFFESFGFSCKGRSKRQYRTGDLELVCAADIRQVWMRALEKLPSLLRRFSIGEHDPTNALLLSIKPKYGFDILEGRKRVEVRRRFSKKWLGQKVVLYATKPTSSLIGEATIASITHAEPNEIWAKFGPQIGCAHEEYSLYTASRSLVSAIEFTDVAPYNVFVSNIEASNLVGQHLVPPQSYCQLRAQKSDKWLKAISAVAFLHNRAERFRSAALRHTSTF